MPSQMASQVGRDNNAPVVRLQEVILGKASGLEPAWAFRSELVGRVELHVV
jgi:hypothetical protein